MAVLIVTSLTSATRRREAGAAIKVSIVYSNPSLFGSVEYSYHVSEDSDSDVGSVYSTISSFSSDSRQRFDLSGIRVTLSQAGTIGAFSLFSLL